MARTAQDILEQASEQRVEFVNLQFTDIVGMVKTVSLTLSQLRQCLEHGSWFDGSSIEGYARIAESDMYLVPDLESYALLPWDSAETYATARLICNVFTPDGRPFPGDPRRVLINMLQQAERLGFAFHVGPELEFFLFHTGSDGRPRLIPHDDAGYFDMSTDQAAMIRRTMVRALQALEIEVESSHHEVAVGQHEIDLAPGPALRMADQTVTCRLALKAIAQQHGLYATFLPKPIAGINGSGMHVHMSLHSLDGRNAFVDPRDPYGLSETARYFIAGLLSHARGMSAVLAPLVNSYKRLVPGYEAPVYLSWGRTNRSALVRVPRVSPGMPQTTRIELRCPDPSCNPYLAFAVMLAAGLDGVQRKLSLTEAAEEDLYHVDPRARKLEMLPISLGEALEELRRDEVVQNALGPHIVERFLEAKTQEWNDYRRQVTQWEIERYLPIF